MPNEQKQRAVTSIRKVDLEHRVFNEFISSIKIQTKKICYFIMLNISFYRNGYVEPSTTVIMRLGTMTVCKIIIVVQILLDRECNLPPIMAKFTPG